MNKLQQSHVPVTEMPPLTVHDRLSFSQADQAILDGNMQGFDNLPPAPAEANVTAQVPGELSFNLSDIAQQYTEGAGLHKWTAERAKAQEERYVALGGLMKAMLDFEAQREEVRSRSLVAASEK